MRSLFIALVLAFAETQAPEPAGLIMGTVVDAESGAPLSGVVVSVTQAGTPQNAAPPFPGRRVITDGQGRFAFRLLPAGRYSLVAVASGGGFNVSGITTGAQPQIGAYISGGYGQRRPDGRFQSIALADGQKLGDAVIRLWKAGSLSGIVVDEAGEPLVGVVVGAAKLATDGALLNGPTVKTDDRGAYRLGSLAPGRYVVIVPQSQPLTPVSSFGRAAALPTDESQRLNLQLFSAGAPTIPLSGITVGASILATGASGFLVNALPPRVVGSEALAYQTTFYPAATSAGRATAIVVGSGEHREGIDLQMRPVSTVLLSGTLMDGSGPVANFGVHLMPADPVPGAWLFEVANTATDAGGHFVFPLVPVGDYTLIAIRNTLPAGTPASEAVSSQPGAWAIQPTSVGPDGASGIAMTLRPGREIKGRVEFDGAAERPPLGQPQPQVFATRTQPLLRSDPGGGRSSRLDAAGQFSITGVFPGRYIVRPLPMRGWDVRSVVAGGRDITDLPIAIDSEDISDVVVTYTDRPIELTGTVRDDKGAPDPDAGVFLFPTDRTRWPDARASTRAFTMIRPARTGAFTFDTLSAGEYFVVAMNDAAAADWPDAAFLARLAAAATTVRIEVGNAPNVVLTTRIIR